MTKRLGRNTLSLSAAPNGSARVFLRVIFPAVALSFAVCLGSPSIAGEISQASESAANARQDKDTPTIRATPQRVRIAGDYGTTEVAWNTGNGSIGFVFVTANGRPPFLVAKASEGSRVISWIRTGEYVFGLYRDVERRSLLATVTVSGVSTESGSPPHTGFLYGQFRWVLVALILLVLYAALYLSAPGQVPTKFPLEPTTSPRRVHVARNLVIGLAAFICVDGLVFHTRLYTSILAPDSYAGRLAVITRAEKERGSSGLKEVLVLGDSRIAEGFSAAVADKLGSVQEMKFVNLAEPASSVSVWDYMLREVDPERGRYWAIVVPYGVGFESNSADRLRISMAAPLLRYGDCFNFASVFQRWSARFRAFTACILRGSAFQSDVVDFLAHPIARIQNARQGPMRLESRALYQGKDYDIVGTSYDPKTGQIIFPPRMTAPQREALRESLLKPSESETQDFLKMQRDGIQRILNRYSASPTRIVLTPIPRGPFASLPGASRTFHAALPSVMMPKAASSLPEQTFNFLEKPEYYFDGYHLNARGRQRFTETLVAELMGRLKSANSPADLDSKSEAVAGPFPLGIYSPVVRTRREAGTTISFIPGTD